MRITQSMLSNNMLSHLTNSYEKMGKLQDQINTQKKITRPSDDPVVAMKGMSYRRNLLEVEQYERNFSEAHNWIENSDTSLDKAGLALQRARELVVQGSSDTYNASERNSIKEEIVQLKEHLVELANTKFGDKYLFNGTNTLEKPVDLTANPPKFSTSTNNVQLELSKGVYVPVNVEPNKVFNEDLFNGLDQLIAKLGDENATGKDISSFLGEVDGFAENITNARAELEAKMNRIELMENRVADQKIIATDVLSKNEDIDFEKVITDLTVQESVHRAALSIGSRIIQPTLMDFLR